jgi:predicted dehydrogenase
VFGAAAAAEIENAFDYEGQRLRIKRLDGKVDATTELALPQKNQFSLEIDHMAHCVRTDTQPRTPGEEGLQDQVIMAAIYEAARTGSPVRLQPSTGLDVFRGPKPADV